MSIETLHTVWQRGGWLGIRCKACGHRAALSQEKLPAIRRENNTPLRTLKLRCATCGATGAGSDHWSMCYPEDWEGARRFLSRYDDADDAKV